MEAPDTPDYYLDLELTPVATSKEITRAFRKLSIKLHPDKNRGKEKEVEPKFVKVHAPFFDANMKPAPSDILSRTTD